MISDQHIAPGITLSELSRRLGRSRAALRKLAKRGTIPCNPDGSFDEAAVRAAYARNTDPVHRKPLRPADEAGARRASGTHSEPANRRAPKPQAPTVDLEGAHLDHSDGDEVVSVAVAVQFWNEFFLNLLNRMHACVSEAAPLLAEMASITACEQFMTDMIDEALLELAENPLPEHLGSATDVGAAIGPSAASPSNRMGKEGRLHV